jgi:hypothetical protein
MSDTPTLYVWTVREKSTGAYFCEREHGYHRGYSHDDPIQPTPKRGIRLFGSERRARQALVAWLQGIYERHYSGPAYLGDEGGEDITVTKVPTRKRENFEIVQFELREVR